MYTENPGKKTLVNILGNKSSSDKADSHKKRLAIKNKLENDINKIWTSISCLKSRVEYLCQLNPKIQKINTGKLKNWILLRQEYTTTGGSPTEEIVNSSIKDYHIPMVSIKEEGSTPRVIKTQKCENGKITVVFDGDPSTDHKLNVVVC